MPPFNTAIVKGFNAVTGARVKLGRWNEYLAMREGVLRLNEEHRDLLSNDLGAVAGLLFDVGSGRYAAPPRAEDAAGLAAWEADLARLCEAQGPAARGLAAACETDATHTEVQAWLRELGLALGFDVWIASNDRGRPWAGGRLGDDCLESLPPALDGGASADSVRLIDVLWLERGQGRVAAAFEVEHTTSIYSGIVRLLDLALGAAAPDLAGGAGRPGRRGGAQLRRPAFTRVSDLHVQYVPYGELARTRDAIARFGSGMKAIHAIARRVV